MEQVLNQIMPYLVSLLVGGLSYLISYIQTKKLKNKVISIEEAINNSEDDYYIFCPHCNAKVDLKSTKIFVMAKQEFEERTDKQVSTCAQPKEESEE